MNRQPRARLSRSDVSRAPNAAWSAFVDLLTSTPFEDLGACQQPAHLAFWYDAEVQKGGHRTYLERYGLARLDATAAGLEGLGCGEHASVLRRAAELWRAGGENEDPAVALDELDARYHRIVPDVATMLEEYLNRNLDEFVRFVD